VIAVHIGRAADGVGHKPHRVRRHHQALALVNQTHRVRVHPAFGADITQFDPVILPRLQGKAAQWHPATAMIMLAVGIDLRR
jgi:hypothetical protein